MITRIFRVKIDPNLREEFEPKFTSISIDAVKKQEGFISVEIGKPTKWAPDEYVMISQWTDEEALRIFVGTTWNIAHIPDGMEKYIKECWVHHYQNYGPA